MFKFISTEKIATFLMSYGIDIGLFTDFELSVIILLSNIVVILAYLFIFYVVYKIIHKILSWWF